MSSSPKWWRRRWPRRRWTNGDWDRGCRTTFKLKRLWQEKQSFILISYTYRCILDHPWEDWWAQRCLEWAIWWAGCTSRLDDLTFSKIWYLHHPAMTLWVKMGEIFGGVALEGEHILRGSKHLLYAFIIYVFWCYVVELVLCFRQCFNYGFATYFVKHLG